MAKPQARRYTSYLVRCWHAADDEARFVVETVSDAPQQWAFHTLDGALAFLRTKLGEDAAQGAAPPLPENKEHL